MLSIAVSAYNTDLILENGQVKFPKYRGNDFFMVAMKRNSDVTFPLTPEKALGRVVTLLRAHVKGVALVLQDARMSPQMAVWRVDLEEPTTVKVAQKMVSAQQIFVNPRGDLLVASPSEPERVQVNYLTVSDPGQVKQGMVPIRSGFALHFDPVSN